MRIATFGDLHLSHIAALDKFKGREELMGGKNDVIIMGHSHQATCLPFGKGVYVNSGDCFCRLMKYISIDTLARTVEVRAFVPPQGHQVIYRWPGNPAIAPSPQQN